MNPFAPLGRYFAELWKAWNNFWFTPTDPATLSFIRLLAGGIYRDREGEVQAALESAGLRVIGRRTEEDWVALELEAA